MSPHGAFFHRLLDESSALIATPPCAGIAIPDDELHREIIVPLLPAMLADAAIRQHWSEQAATGFLARLVRHFDGGDPAPRWLAGDFEIHVTASYSAGPDARALADTLLSEDSLRDMTATLMNQLLDVLWPSLALIPIPAETEAEAEIPASEIAAPVPAEIPEPIILPEAEPAHAEPVGIAEVIPSMQPPSRALIRALCRKLPRAAVRRGLVANCARAATAAVFARRIYAHAASHATLRNAEQRAVRAKVVPAALRRNARDSRGGPREPL